MSKWVLLVVEIIKINFLVYVSYQIFQLEKVLKKSNVTGSVVLFNIVVIALPFFCNMLIIPVFHSYEISDVLLFLYSVKMFLF